MAFTDVEEAHNNEITINNSEYVTGYWLICLEIKFSLATKIEPAQFKTKFHYVLRVLLMLRVESWRAPSKSNEIIARTMTSAANKSLPMTKLSIRRTTGLPGRIRKYIKQRSNSGLGSIE